MQTSCSVAALSMVLSWYLVSGVIQHSFYQVYYGYEIISFYEEQSLQSLVRCAVYCNMSTACVAATFDVSLKQCRLIDQPGLMASMSDPNKRTISLVGDANATICRIPPPTVTNGTFMITQTSTGAYADLNCNIYYKIATSSPSTVYCTHGIGWGNTTDMECRPVNRCTMGTSFVMAFMTCELPKLLIASEEPGTVRIELPYFGINTEYTVSNSLAPTYVQSATVTTPRTIEKKVVFVTSDVPIQLYMNHVSSGSADGSVVIPIHLLGKEYFVAGYTSTQYGMSEFLMASLNDGTRITIEYTRGTTETVTLNANDTYLIRDLNLTGTRVIASSPIFVLSGHQCANVPDVSVPYCDHIDEVMPPVTSLGTTHIISYMSPRPDFTISIVAVQNSTNVTFYDSNGSIIEVVSNLIQSSSFYRTYYGSKTISVISNKPIMVHQYGHGSGGIFGDPSMMFIPDVGFYGQRYNFVISPDSFDWKLTVIIADTMSTSMLEINDLPLAATQIVYVTLPDNNTYTVLYADVNPGNNALLHVSGDAAIYGAWVYGRVSNREIAYALGFAA